MVGGFAAALVVGAGQELFAGCEKVVGRDALLGHEAAFGVLMGFERAVSADVLDLGHVAQVTADQDGAVALKRVFLGAHKGGTKFLDALGDAVHAGLEGRGFGDPFITGDAVNVAVALGAAGAEFVAEEQVADAGGAEGGFERFAIELGKAGAVRTAAHVNQDLDAMLPEQLEEMSQRVVRVANGEKLGLHVSKKVAQILYCLPFNSGVRLRQKYQPAGFGTVSVSGMLGHWEVAPGSLKRRSNSGSVTDIS